jgi:isopentenyldiphosphate isomerase
MADEMLTLVTDEDEVLGPIARKLVHGNPSLIHRSVHVLVVGPDGRLLLQKRSLSKDTQPGKWDTSVGGHVGYGQSYAEAARREASEELGLDLEGPVFLYPSRIRNPIESENIHTFLQVSAGPFRAEPGEIDELRFWTRGEIDSALGSGVFTSNFEEEYALFLASPYGSLMR